MNDETDETEGSTFVKVLVFVGKVLFYIVVGVIFVIAAVLKGPMNRVRRESDWQDDE